MIALLMSVGACSTTKVEQEQPEPVAVAPDVVAELPIPQISRRAAPAVAERRIIPAPPAEPTIAVVLSSRVPAYEDIAIELQRHFDGSAIYDLSDRSQPPVTAFRVINDTDSTAVVAIGLRAARSAVAMSTSPVVFSQVFNYGDHDLLTDNSRGVAALPPLDLQLGEWKRLSPGLSRVGLIVGAGHEDLVTEAELAAQRHDVDLVVRTSRSDQETLYIFRRLVRNVDGLWLIPDNRVLSSRVLTDILAESRRHRVQAVVPSETMLSMGGAISMSTVPTDVAARIAEVVRRVQLQGIGSIPALTPLTEIRTLTNRAWFNRQVVAEASE